MSNNPPYPASGFVTPPFWVGGYGGSNFMSCGWIDFKQALVVKRFDMWWNDDTIKGLQITYSDDSRDAPHGQLSGTNASISFAPGERVTSLSLWGNGSGTRCGRVRMATNAGQVFDYGKNTDGQSRYDGPVGGGLWIGISGKSGNDIDMLGFIFTSAPVSNMTVTDVKYVLSSDTQGIMPTTMDSVHYIGAPGTGTDWQFGGQASRTDSTTFRQLSTTTYGASIDVTLSAEFLGIGGSATAGFKWEQTNETETTTGTSKEVDLTWNESGHLAPGQGVTLLALVQQGTIALPYSSTVRINLTDGNNIYYTESGILNNVSRSTAYIKQIPDPPSGVSAFLIEKPLTALKPVTAR